MLRILSPLSSLREVKPLVETGADEFYCGLFSSRCSLNDRPNNVKYNFPDSSALSKAVSRVKNLNKKIYLTINKPSINIREAVAQAKIAERLRMDGVIVSDLLLIQTLRDMNLRLELNGSCLGAVFNSRSIRFFEQLGIETFHLPRQLGLDQLRMIRRSHPKAKLSVFGMRGLCVNVEAFCLLHELKAGVFKPCESFYVKGVAGKTLISKKDLNVKLNMPRYSCGLCALYRLNNLGIDSIKIEGRGADIKSKASSVLAVREALNFLSSCSQEDVFCRFCRKLFRRNFGEACQEQYCYF